MAHHAICLSGDDKKLDKRDRSRYQDAALQVAVLPFSLCELVLSRIETCDVTGVYELR